MPDEMPEYRLQAGQTVLDVLVEAGLVSSKSEGKRMFKQHAVRFEGETLDDPEAGLTASGVLQVGKRRFLQVIV